MATKKLFFLFSILFSIVGTKALAYSIAVENADGVTIYYDLYRDVNTNEEGAVVTYKKSYPDLTYYSDYTGNVVIPEEVTHMGRTIKVTTIGARAFWRCTGLTSVTIPNSVTSIGISAFYYCSSLTSITIPNGVTSIGDYTFCGCSSLPSLTIPNGVTSIGKLAFLECSGLSSITIPNSVTSIGGRAFENCSGLTSVTLSNSLTSIEYNAFYGCSGLTSITIPNSVTSIGGWAFSKCSGLTEVISLIENPFKIESTVFSDDTYKNAKLTVPEGTIGKYKSTDGWKNFYDFKDNPNGGDDPAEDPQDDDPIVDPQEGDGNKTYVDLGLPSGLLWATCNLGASSPEEVGGYYAWGETSRRTFFSKDNYQYNRKPINLNDISGTEYDAATSAWGGTWRMPTREELLELVQKCTRKEITLNGKPCLKLVGPNGNSIYIPKGGFGDEGGGLKLDGYGLWSSTSKSAYLAYRVWEWENLNVSNTWQGIPIRPVTSEKPEEVISIRDIYVSTAGTLSDYIPDAEKYQIKYLVLSGELNGTDLGFLREMAGKKKKSNNNFFNDTEGKLESLDISGAKIVPGGYSLLIEEIDNDFDYTVTRENEIPPRLFEGCNKLTNIKIPENVNSIGNSAFWGTKWYENQPDGAVYIGNVFYAYKGEMPANTNVAIKDGTLGIACSAFRNCTNLVSVTIPSSVTNIGGHNAYPNIGFDGPFDGCTGLNSVITKITSPRAFDNDTFYSSGGSIYSNAILYVPKGTIDLYKSTEGWNNFMNIVDTDPTGINKVMFNGGKNALIFDLQGRRVSQPQKGINIIGGKKVIVK